MRRRRILLALTAIIVSVGSGTAYGYFTASASAQGTGQGSSGTMAAVTVSAGTPNSTLVPGSTGDVSLQVTNSNTFAVTLISVTGNGTITGSGSCSPGLTVTFAPQTGLSVPIAASATTQVHLANAATMTSAAPANCQGATFSIPVAVVVQK
jgi:hypothetical protein